MEPPNATALVAACAAMVQQRIAYTARCPGFSPGGDVDAQAAIATCVGVATAPGSSVAVADVEACTQQLAAPCAASLYPSCAGYGADVIYPNHDKKGTGPAGASCSAQLQCESGYCGTDPGTPCGVCKIPRDVGQPCSGPLDTCIGDAQCIAGACQLPGKPEGAQCIDYGTECQSALYCSTGGTGINGVCTALPGAGKLCASGRCAADSACVSGTCLGRLPDGATCDADRPCQHVCTGVCRTQKVVGANEACSVDACGPGLQCSSDPAHPVCVPEATSPKGASCAAQAPTCAVGLNCDAITAVCVDPPGQGAPCTPYGTCGQGFACEGFDPGAHQTGLCTRVGEVGEPCPCPFELACVRGVCVAYGAAACM